MPWVSRTGVLGELAISFCGMYSTGGVTGLASGASRTATAYERMLEGSAPSDLLVLDPGALNPADRIDLDLLRDETPGSLCSFERPSMELTARWEYTNMADHITSPAFAPRHSWRPTRYGL